MRDNNKIFFVNVVVFVIVVVIVGVGGEARATTIIPANLTDLAHDAIAIARGRVTAIVGRWTDDRRGIETIVTLDVDEYLKGGLGSTVQFRVPGGLLGRFRSIVVGAPRFAVDDRVIVFLGTQGPMIPYIVGFSQGVYRVGRDADRGQWRVMPPLLPSAGDSPAKVVRGDPARVPLALDTFEARVRALAGNTK